ncbi:hypothetical protein D046_8218B, partial [Vibrio parahaemolyticus V-223/04]
SPKP